MTEWTITLFIFGLIIGSFLNVVIFRIDDLRSILTTRSQCRSCQQTIAWYDLVPFISFFLLRAKCRNCGEKISIQYPLVEGGTGLLFAYLYLMYGLSWSLAFYLIIFSILLVVFVYDLKTQTVPEIVVWLAVVISLLGGAYFGGFTLLSMIYGGIIGGGFLFLLVYFSKERWMGWGDVKIGLILGLLTGYPNAIFALFFAFILGSIFGLALMYFQKKTIQTAIPFAPFIIFSTLFSLTYGQIFINWYLNLFMLK